MTIRTDNGRKAGAQYDDKGMLFMHQVMEGRRNRAENSTARKEAIDL